MDPAPPSSNNRDDLYYQAIVTGWITTKFERDKSLLTLSGGGIGLAVTLMTTITPISSSLLWLFGLSALSFITSLVSIIVVFDKNADHFLSVVNNHTDSDPKLKALDLLSFWSFIFGAVLLSTIGLCAGLDKLSKAKEEQTMSSNIETKNTTSPPLLKSISGVGALRPQPTSTQQNQPSQTSTPTGQMKSQGEK